MNGPEQIPDHVAVAALNRYYDELEAWDPDDVRGMAEAIAAALDALMDDEPVYVEDVEAEEGETYKHWVRPADVLAAVLERARGKS